MYRLPHGLGGGEPGGGRGWPAFGAPVADGIAYWSERDPWFIAPANTAARQRLRALLTANPHNLRLALELERRPEEPALPRLGEIKVPTLIVVGVQDIPDVHPLWRHPGRDPGRQAGGSPR